MMDKQTVISLRHYNRNWASWNVHKIFSCTPLYDCNLGVLHNASTTRLPSFICTCFSDVLIAYFDQIHLLGSFGTYQRLMTLYYSERNHVFLSILWILNVKSGYTVNIYNTYSVLYIDSLILLLVLTLQSRGRQCSGITLQVALQSTCIILHTCNPVFLLEQALPLRFLLIFLIFMWDFVDFIFTFVIIQHVILREDFLQIMMHHLPDPPHVRYAALGAFHCEMISFSHFLQVLPYAGHLLTGCSCPQNLQCLIISACEEDLGGALLWFL